MLVDVELDFPYELAAVDLDGTLLGSDHHRISAENKRAVQRLVENGVVVVLASAPIDQMTMYHRQLKLTGPMVVSNGALVCHPHSPDMPIFEARLPGNLASELLHLAQRHGVTAVSFLKDVVCVTSRHHWNCNLQGLLDDPNLKVHFSKPADLTGRMAQLHKTIWSSPRAHVDELHAVATDLYGAYLSICRLDDETIEFMPSGVNKAVGVRAVANHLGIDMTRVAGYGDGGNDCEMLREVGFGVAMHHGDPRAKAAAKMVAPPSSPATNFAAAVNAVFDGSHVPIFSSS